MPESYRNLTQSPSNPSPLSVKCCRHALVRVADPDASASLGNALWLRLFLSRSPYGRAQVMPVVWLRLRSEEARPRRALAAVGRTAGRPGRIPRVSHGIGPYNPIAPTHRPRNARALAPVMPPDAAPTPGARREYRAPSKRSRAGSSLPSLGNANPADAVAPCRPRQQPVSQSQTARHCSQAKPEHINRQTQRIALVQRGRRREGLDHAAVAPVHRTRSAMDPMT
jgi:hypothetical protein